MPKLHYWIGPLLAGSILAATAEAHAQGQASLDATGPFGTPPTAASPAPVAPRVTTDQPSVNPPPSKVATVEKKGFTFYPSVQDPGAFRFSLGALYDAIDPAVMYGFKFRLPQVVLDARYGFGHGWSLKGHLNSILITNELLVGGSYAWHAGNWAFEGTFTVGAYIGKLGQLGFDVLLLSPEYRPELSVGYDLGTVALSLRGSLYLMGPETMNVGGSRGGLDNSHAFAGHSETLYVENTTQSNGVWYFGAGVVTARSYYALWVLFPDSPGLFTYPRVVAGYEF